MHFKISFAFEVAFQNFFEARRIEFLSIDRSTHARSTLDHVERESCETRLFVARLHIETRHVHGVNHLIE